MYDVQETDQVSCSQTKSGQAGFQTKAAFTYHAYLSTEIGVQFDYMYFSFIFLFTMKKIDHAGFCAKIRVIDKSRLTVFCICEKNKL